MTKSKELKNKVKEAKVVTKIEQKKLKKLEQDMYLVVKNAINKKITEETYFGKEDVKKEYFELLNDEDYQKQLETPLQYDDIKHVLIKPLRALTLFEKKKIVKDLGYYTAFGKSLVPFLYDLINKGLFIVGAIGAGKTVTMNQINHGVHINGKKVSLGLVDLNEAMFIYVRKESDFVGDMYRKGIDIKLGSRDYDAKNVNYAAALKDPLTGKADSTMCELWAKTIISGDSHFDKQAILVAVPFLEDIAEIPNVDNKIMMDTILSVGRTAESLLEHLENSPTVIAKGKFGTIQRALTTDNQGNLDGQGGSVFASLNDFFNKLVDEQFYYSASEDDFIHKEYILNEMNQNIIRRRVFIMNTTDSDNNDFYTQINIKLIFKFGLQLQQNQFDRMWMLMDEIQSVASAGNEKSGKLFLTEYISFMAESRSYGWCHIAGTQSISRLEAILESKFNRRAFYQMFTCKLYMKYNEPEDLEYVVKDFGKSRLKKTKENISIGVELEGDRISESEEEKIENVIEADEIGSLPNLSGYIRLGNFPPAFIQYDYWSPKKIHKRIRGLENKFDMGTTSRHYHDMIIQTFKKHLIDALIKCNFQKFSYEKFLAFNKLHYKAKEAFGEKLERASKVRGERLLRYLPFLFEEELIIDFCEKHVGSEDFKTTDEVYKLFIKETGLYSLNRNLRILEVLNKTFEVKDMQRIEMVGTKEKIVKFKQLVYLTPQVEETNIVDNSTNTESQAEDNSEELEQMYGDVQVMQEPDIDISETLDVDDVIPEEVLDIDISDIQSDEYDFEDNFVPEADEIPVGDELNY